MSTKKFLFLFMKFGLGDFDKFMVEPTVESLRPRREVFISPSPKWLCIFSASVDWSRPSKPKVSGCVIKLTAILPCILLPYLYRARRKLW